MEEATTPTALHARVHLDTLGHYVRQISMSVHQIPVNTVAHARIKSICMNVTVCLVLLACSVKQI